MGNGAGNSVEPDGKMARGVTGIMRKLCGMSRQAIDNMAVLFRVFVACSGNFII